VTKRKKGNGERRKLWGDRSQERGYIGSRVKDKTDVTDRGGVGKKGRPKTFITIASGFKKKGLLSGKEILPIAEEGRNAGVTYKEGGVPTDFSENEAP